MADAEEEVGVEAPYVAYDEDQREVVALQDGGHDDFWVSARKGDLTRIRFLCEVELSPDINRRDPFDGCPLYYACLCGHLPCPCLSVACRAPGWMPPCHANLPLT